MENVNITKNWIVLQDFILQDKNFVVKLFGINL